MIIRTAVIIATLMIVIMKSDKTDIIVEMNIVVVKTRYCGYNSTSVPLTTIQVKPVTAK